jgi:hypothetical protein
MTRTTAARVWAVTFALLIAVATLLSSGEASAQSLSAEAVHHWSSEGDVHSPFGFRGSLRAGIFLLALESVHDEQRRYAGFCTGLIPPDVDCTPKESAIETRMTNVLIGLAPRFKSFGAHVGVGFSLLNADWRALAGPDRLHEDQGYATLEIGADYRYRLGATPFSAKAGATGRLLLGHESNCVDCSTRYDDGFRMVGVLVGLEYLLRN